MTDQRRARGTAAFLDTSIQIARIVHGPKTKARIRDRLQQFDLTTTGLVVRQEFKRRLLKEASYLLRQLERRGSYAEVQRHVNDVLPPQQNRKRQICTQTLYTVFEGEDDQSLTDRLRLFLRSLLQDGLWEFDESVDHVHEDSECACASLEIRPKANGRDFEFGTDKCSRTQGECGIARFLDKHRERLAKLLEFLRGLPEERKSNELDRAERFIEEVLNSLAGVESTDPCYTVGDLLIALESAGIPTFFTMNGKESQHLCRVLDQNLVVRRNNPDQDDVLCRRDAAEWPSFW